MVYRPTRRFFVLSPLNNVYNENTDEFGYYLIINGELILTTPEHPFFSDTLEQVPAAELQVGDRVWQGEAGYGVVETVAFVSQPQVMYNLTVAEAHTYFVGEGRWLVHNAKCWEVGKRSVIEQRSTIFCRCICLRR